MKWHRVLAVACILGSLTTMSSSALAQESHWATAVAQKAVTAGLWSGPVEDLSQPISPKDWHAMIRALVGVAPGQESDGLSNAAWESTLFLTKNASYITREQAVGGLAKLISRFDPTIVFSHSERNLAPYQDEGQIGEEHRMLVSVAVAQGWFGGADGQLRPKDPLTRGEAAVLITRVRDRYASVVGANRAVATITGHRPLGFGQGWGKSIDIKPERALPGLSGTGAGNRGLVVHGAALAKVVAGQRAPSGQTWAVLDVAMATGDAHEFRLLDVVDMQLMSEGVHWSGKGSGGSVYELNLEATKALDPELLTTKLVQNTIVRVLAVFAVPENTTNLWYTFAWSNDPADKLPHGHGVGFSGHLVAE